MPRPCRRRRVRNMPRVAYFKPAGVRMSGLQEVILSVEEFEAVRLKDFEELDQQEAAKQMGISQPTFHRLLVGARKKMADAIVHGKALRVEGGIFDLDT